MSSYPPLFARHTSYQQQQAAGIPFNTADLDAELNDIAESLSQVVQWLMGITVATGQLKNLAVATAQALAGAQSFTATAGQTVFTTTIVWDSAFTTLSTLVTVNGAAVVPSAVADSGGFLRVTLASPAVDGDAVVIRAFSSGAGIATVLASTSASQGASQVGIADVDGLFAGPNVELALRELRLIFDAFLAAINSATGSALFSATPAQTVFDCNTPPNDIPWDGSLSTRTVFVYKNGALLTPSAFSVSNQGGFLRVTLGSGAAALDEVQVNTYSLSSVWTTSGRDLAGRGAQDDFQMNGNRVVDLADGVDPQDAATVAQLNALFGAISGAGAQFLRTDGGNSPTTDIDWDGNKIVGLGAPTSDNDAVRKEYADNLLTVVKGVTGVAVATPVVLAATDWGKFIWNYGAAPITLPAPAANKKLWVAAVGAGFTLTAPSGTIAVALGAPAASMALPAGTFGFVVSDGMNYFFHRGYDTAVVDLKAPLASPALTGSPTAPTAPPGDNDTTIATTAFVQQEIATGLGGSSSFAAKTVSGKAIGEQSLLECRALATGTADLLYLPKGFPNVDVNIASTPGTVTVSGSTVRAQIGNSPVAAVLRKITAEPMPVAYALRATASDTEGVLGALNIGPKPAGANFLIAYMKGSNGRDAGGGTGGASGGAGGRRCLKIPLAGVGATDPIRLVIGGRAYNGDPDTQNYVGADAVTFEGCTVERSGTGPRGGGADGGFPGGGGTAAAIFGGTTPLAVASGGGGGGIDNWQSSSVDGGGGAGGGASLGAGADGTWTGSENDGGNGGAGGAGLAGGVVVVASTAGGNPSNGPWTGGTAGANGGGGGGGASATESTGIQSGGAGGAGGVAAITGTVDLGDLDPLAAYPLLDLATGITQTLGGAYLVVHFSDT